MKYLIIVLLFSMLVSCNSQKDKNMHPDNFSIGIIADCQYCNCPSKGNRFYKSSSHRLKMAVDELNKHELDYTIHLGDFIDRDFSSFDTLIPIWNKLRSEKYHVLGNHDFSVADSLKKHIAKKLNITDRYYSFNKKNWKFIILDGNDLSYHGSMDSLNLKEADLLYNKVKNEEKVNAQTWNGGIGKQQLEWVKNELIKATKANQNVGFYCHFPIAPENVHNLWNSQDIIELSNQFSCIKFYGNGHNHAGNYTAVNGVHYITFKGMVDTKDSTAYSIASFTNDSIFIKGFGREVDRKLKIRLN